MRRFPLTLDTDTTEVRDALEIARTQYNRGDLDDAMRWLHRAADIAYEQRQDERAASLANSLGALSPPRAPAPRAATESARPRAAEPMPINAAPRALARPGVDGRVASRSHVLRERPVTAPASTSVAPRVAQPTERTASPRRRRRPAASAPRSMVPSRPVPIPQGAFEAPGDAFLPPDDASTSEAFLLTARKVEPFSLDDDSTHVGAAPAGFLAAVAAEASLSKTTPVIEKPAARTPAAVKPTAQPSQRPPAMQSSAPSPRQPAPQRASHARGEVDARAVAAARPGRAGRAAEERREVVAADRVSATRRPRRAARAEGLVAARGRDARSRAARGHAARRRGVLALGRRRRRRRPHEPGDHSAGPFTRWSPR